jgi:hypothetical protein
MENDGYDLRWKDHVRDVFGEVQKLRARDYFSDLIVHCGGRNFRAHKVILAASSTFFERVLTGVPKDRAQVLVMSQTQPDLLERVLNFIYDGETFVPAELLDTFMSTAETLGIRGLGKDVAGGGDSLDGSRESRKRPAARSVKPGEDSRVEKGGGGGGAGADPLSSAKRPRPSDSLVKPSVSSSTVVIEPAGDKAGPSRSSRAGSLQLLSASGKVINACF